MSITNELREYADTLSERARYGATIPSPLNPHSGAPIGPTKETEELYTIADRIDIEHERECKEQYACGAEHGIAASIEASMIQDNGYIALPKDANGEYIHIGDELDGYGYPKGGAYCKAIVNEVTILAGPKESSYRSWLMWDATEVRHHHEPTVEDLLEEMSDALDDARIPNGSEKRTYEEIIAEYAAKLQLRGDGE